MRGSAKRLQPILAESILAVIDESDDATVGALIRWYAVAYDKMTDAREAADGPDATYDDLATAVRSAELPSLPDALENERGRLAVAVVRRSAQAMILGDARKTLAGRALKREHRLREAARTAEAVAAASSETAVELRAVADEIEEESSACPTDKPDKQDKQDKQDRDALRASSPPNPSFKNPKTSKNQSINARARAGARDAARPSVWACPYNPDGHDPVDLALRFTGEPRDDTRARACWGAHLRRLGARVFCEALHAFEIDSQTGRLDNRAAALNAHLSQLSTP